VIYNLTLAHKNMKTQIFVMPAWMAGIQIRKDAYGDIHVKLDSSAPCWNDGIEGFCLKLTEAPPSRGLGGDSRSDLT
jgi:hypothetical protein